MRWVSTRVLPDPAPARISSGPSPCTTASRWGGLRPASSSSILGSWAASGMPIHGTEQGGRVHVAEVNGGWGGERGGGGGGAAPPPRRISSISRRSGGVRATKCVSWTHYVDVDRRRGSE